MNPRLKHAGIAGVLTGLGLALEFTFFPLGGYSPQNFGSAAAALAFLRHQGDLFLRLAVVFGLAGALVRIVYVAGLAAVLREKTPTQAVATLYFGVLGSLGHGLVALTFYIGFPQLVALAAQDHGAAEQTWNAFALMTSGYQALGNALLGFMLVGTGWAIISRKALPVAIGWLGLLAGVVTLVEVFTSGTPLAVLGFLAYLPTFILVIAFDLWVGVTLWKSKRDLRTTSIPDAQTPEEEKGRQDRVN
jgi:hypothetical protein